MTRTSRLKLEPGSRSFLETIHSLAVDNDGREHLVGLTVRESNWYLKYARSRWGRRDKPGMAVDKERKRYLTLHAKYQRARFRDIVAARASARNDGSS
jgi:hypothetical protein